MEAIVELKLCYGTRDIAKISKSFEVSSIFSDEGLMSSIKLTDSISIREKLKPAEIDIDSNIVTLQKVFSTDISKLLAKNALNKFIEDMKLQNWNVETYQESIDKLNEPPKPKVVIENEKIVNQKPKLISVLYSFFLIFIIFTLITYFFNNEKFDLIYFISILPFLLVGVVIPHILSVRKYNKAKTDLSSSAQLCVSYI